MKKLSPHETRETYKTSVEDGEIEVSVTYVEHEARLVQLRLLQSGQDYSFDPELLERVAALVAYSRKANGDKREACIRHGYQQPEGGWGPCEACAQDEQAEDSVRRLDGKSVADIMQFQEVEK